VPYFDSALRCDDLRMATAIGSIMAVVAVFEMNAERNAVRPMK